MGTFEMSESNYEVTLTDGVPIKSWTKGVPFEDEARDQLRKLATLQFVHKHIAVMSDVHLGIGCSVGTVLATQGAIIPAAVGVDIGCGMMAVRLGLTASDLPDSLSAMRSAIEAAVPHGMSKGSNDKGSWSNDAPGAVQAAWELHLASQWMDIINAHPELDKGRHYQQLGTLGGGNHFIELCLDENQDVWLVVHSGSRGPGNRIGRYFIEKAKKDMERWMVQLPSEDLAYLPEGSDNYAEYVFCVGWAQRFAECNRKVMAVNATRAIMATLGLGTTGMAGSGPPWGHVVSCHHNYIAKENHFNANVWVTRKGAVSAREGELGIIPGSMGERSFIVRGKGNPDSFCSCSHGAGRVMSRTEAKATITLEDHARATAGVECRKDESVLDESPRAYKDIDAVMAAQADLVEVVHTLKQVLCVKG